MCPIKPVETEESCMSESPKKKKKKKRQAFTPIRQMRVKSIKEKKILKYLFVAFFLYIKVQ